MKTILILNELEKKVLSVPDRELSLVGIPDFHFKFKEGKFGPYDFIFHSVDFQKPTFSNKELLVVPYINLNPESTKAIKSLYQIHKTNPLINTFVFKSSNKKECFYKGEKQEVNALTFYTINPIKLDEGITGQEVKENQRDYFTVTEQDLEKNSTNWYELKTYLDEKRNAINKEFRS